MRVLLILHLVAVLAVPRPALVVVLVLLPLYHGVTVLLPLPGRPRVLAPPRLWRGLHLTPVGTAQVVIGARWWLLHVIVPTVATVVVRAAIVVIIARAAVTAGHPQPAVTASAVVLASTLVTIIPTAKDTVLVLSCW